MAGIAELLSQAKAFHRTGQFSEAEPLCRQILQLDPDQAEATLLLGVACDSLGRKDEALRHLQRAAELRPELAEVQNYLGAVLAQQGQLDEALARFEQACRLKPQSIELAQNLRSARAARHNSQGVSLAAAGRWDEAAASYRQALSDAPDFFQAWGNLGNALKAQGIADEASHCYRRVLALAPNSCEAHYNLGLIAKDQGRLADAADRFQWAVTLNPQFAEAYSNLGAVLADQRKFAEAAIAYRQALALRPDFVESHANLAVVLLMRGELEVAAESCRRALALDPERAEAHVNLGNICKHQGDFDAAVRCLERAVDLKPGLALAHYNLALAKVCQQNLPAAAASFEQALVLEPDDVETRFGRALLWLQTGRSAEGWVEYEWRFRRPGQQEEPLPQPRWTGEPLAGRTILLQTEQGLGDAIQFIRYAKLVKQRGGTVIVECQSALTRFLATAEGVDRVIARGEPRPEFDVRAPLMSLPGVFGTTLADLPAEVPYLKPDAELAARWKEELSNQRALKIGIAWQGNRTYLADYVRSFPLAHFEGLAHTGGVRLYSLQMGAGREQLTEQACRWPIVDLGDRLGDFSSTAAIVSNLDLVISSDSAPVHLAGALGVPVWVALAYSPDWRWLLDRTDSPWYPTIRLFRQHRPGDWNGVFQEIEAALAQIV